MGLVVELKVDLLAPVGNIPVDGFPGPPLGGYASYCLVDYRGDDCQSVGGCRDGGNLDYFGNLNNYVVLRGRNPSNNDGDLGDSGNARSCGVIDWGNFGPQHNIDCPDCNMLCRRCSLCSNVAGFVPWPWRFSSLCGRLDRIRTRLDSVNCSCGCAVQHVVLALFDRMCP